MVFWVMWLFNVQWVKKTMAFLGVLLIFLGMFSIYLSLEARDSDALKMTQISKDIYLSITFMTSSLFVLGVLALVGAWKNPLACRVMFSLGGIVLLIMYAYYGIKVKIQSSKIIEAFDTYECDMLKQYQFQAKYDNSIDDTKKATYDIIDPYVKFFNDIYLLGRNSYWRKTPYGCPWQLSPKLVSTFYYNGTDESVVTNVQGCSDKILGSYENYTLDLNQKEFISYFKFIGELEREYKCSGFWAQEDVYYFYDITYGPPTQKWDKAIVDDVIPYNINIYASNLLIISAILFFCVFIHFGLFKKPQKSEDFSRVANTTSIQNVTQISRLEDESQVSKF